MAVRICVSFIREIIDIIGQSPDGTAKFVQLDLKNPRSSAEQICWARTCKLGDRPASSFGSNLLPEKSAACIASSRPARPPYASGQLSIFGQSIHGLARISVATVFFIRRLNQKPALRRHQQRRPAPIQAQSTGSPSDHRFLAPQFHSLPPGWEIQTARNCCNISLPLWNDPQTIL